MAEKVEPLSAAAHAAEQIEQPYTLGMTQIVPSLTNTFSKKGELSIVFLIYNPVLGADKKPDVAVEYSFYQKVARRGDRREVLQQDQSAGVQRQDAAAAVRPGARDTSWWRASRCRSGVSRKASTGSRSR